MELLKFVFVFVVKTVTREYSELMRVPAPVLASTLEPEFLVVPSSSFSYDSPPASASDRRETRGKEEGRKEERKPSTETLLADRAVSSSSSREETTASVPVSSAARSHTSVESQDNARGGKEAGEEGFHKSQPSIDSRGYVSLASIPEKSQRTDIRMDNNGFPSPLSPKRKFTGTSPLNSDIGMPFTVHTSSACGKNEPVVTTLNNSVVEPVSLAAIASSLEHTPAKSSVLSTTCNVTGSQAPPMAVLSLPNNVESSANPQKITSPSKKPIILSRRSSRSSEQNIPQGLVVLVPTIEDAKRLIASTGGNSDGHTPVLVPQHMLNDIHSKNAVGEGERETQRQILGKRTLDMVSPPLSTQAKRAAVDSVVID